MSDGGREGHKLFLSNSKWAGVPIMWPSPSHFNNENLKFILMLFNKTKVDISQKKKKHQYSLLTHIYGI